MQAPPEKHAFVAALNPPGSKLNDALLVVDVDPESRTYGQRVGEVKMRSLVMSCTTSVGMRVVRPFARMRRIRTSSVATWLCLACAHLAFTSLIRNRIRENPR